MRLFPGTGIQSRPSFHAQFLAANKSSHSAEEMPHSLQPESAQQLSSPVNFFCQPPVTELIPLFLKHPAPSTKLRTRHRTRRSAISIPPTPSGP